MPRNRNKTRFTGASVGDYIASRANEHQRGLADLDRSVLEQLVVGSIAEVRRRYR